MASINDASRAIELLRQTSKDASALADELEAGAVHSVESVAEAAGTFAERLSVVEKLLTPDIRWVRR